jgi:O-antigen ligase
VRALTLHLMVLTVFVEGVDIGPTSVGRVVVVLAVLVALVEVIHKRALPTPHPAVLVPVGLLTAWTVLSSIWAVSQAAWLEACLQLALALGFFFAYVTLIDSRERMRQLLLTFVLGATAAALVGLSQFSQEVRAVGLQGDPNTYALYELAALPIAVALGWRARGGRKLFWILVSALLLTAVFASQSRGALFGLAVVVAWMVMVEVDQEGAPSRQVRVLVGVVLTLVLTGIVSLFPRLSPASVMEDRGTGRVDIWLAAWRAWQDNPLLGLGAGGFEARSSALLSQTPGVQLSPYSQLFEGIRVHSAYLEPLVELGPVGLAAFVALLAGAALVLRRDQRLRPSGLLAVLLPMLLAYATTTVFLSTMNNKLLWMLIGMAAVLPYLPESTRTPAAPRPAMEVR